MKNITCSALIIFFVSLWGSSLAQCTVDTANTTTGFTPRTPHVIQPGVPYSQTVQVYIPATFSGLTIDSLHIDTVTGMPSGINYVLSPASGKVTGGGNGAICFSGTTNATPGPYGIVFSGFIYTATDTFPISAVSSKFSYTLKVETAPVAAFTADSPACAGVDSVILTDETSGYPTSWSWTIPGGSPDTSHLQDPSVFFDSAGTYMVTLIAKNSISSDTVTLPVVVNPNLNGTVVTTPATGDSSADGSATVILSGGTPPFNYLWSNNSVTDSITNVLPGTYWVLTNDAKGCQYVNDNINISFVNGIRSLSDAGPAIIYPNPASDVLNLEWPGASNSEIGIYDLSGHIVRQWTSNFEEHTAFNIHDLASGTYVIRITDKSSNGQQSLLFCVANNAKQ